MHDLTLLDYRTNVLGLVGDTDYDTTLVDQAINWFIFEIHNKYNIRYMQSSATLSVPINAASVDFPDDFNKLQSLWMTSPQVIDLSNNELDYRSFMTSYANFTTSAPAQINQFLYFGDGIRFTARSKTAATLQLDYFAVPERMEEGDECVVPDNYEEMVSKGGLIRLMEINEDYDEADNERRLLAPLIQAFVKNQGFGQTSLGPNVMGRGGQRKRAWNAKDDF